MAKPAKPAVKAKRTTKTSKKAAIEPKAGKEKMGKQAVGRPTDYKPEYSEQAKKLCLLGSTDKDLAEFFDVSEQTINAWKHAHPQFLESVKEGKVQADAKVAESLFKRATGYVARKTVTATFNGIVTDVKEVDDFVGPDTAAGIFWLKNRQKEKWRDKQDLEHSGPNGGPQEHKVDVALTPSDAYLQMIGKK